MTLREHLAKIESLLEKIADTSELRNNEFLSVAHAAAICDCSIRLIYTAIQAGEIVPSDIRAPGTRKPHFRIAREDLVAWVQQRKKH